MRDIRSDLQERKTLIDGEIRAAYAYFEQTFQQLQSERDARIADLKAGLAMIAKVMEVEDRLLGEVSAPSSPLMVLADLFMRKLNEAGTMSRQELIDLAVREGFFSDREQAVQGIHPMLVNLLRSELICELPDGSFAPPSLPQAIQLRGVV